MQYLCTSPQTKETGLSICGEINGILLFRRENVETGKATHHESILLYRSQETTGVYCIFVFASTPQYVSTRNS